MPGSASAAVRPLTRREYDTLVAEGAFVGERVELLDGVIYTTSPQGPRSAGIVQRLTKRLVLALGDRAGVRPQLPFAASDRSEPEPDLCVVEPGEHLDDHPSACLLAIEIASTSVDYDHGKLRLYADAGVPEVWIANLPEDVVEVYRDPANGRYRTVRTLGRGERLEAARLDLDLAVAELLP